MTQSPLRMDPNLWAYMTRFRDNGDGYNFIGQCLPWTGKFKIDRKDLEEFWSLYSDTLSRYDRDEGPRDGPSIFLSGISERPNEYLPLLVDIDLETRLDPALDLTQRLYTFDQVKIVAQVYRKVLKEVCREYRARNMVCFVLQKPAPYVSGERVKGGFHLHFPRLWIRNCDHDLHIYPRVKRMLSDEHPGLFDRCQLRATGDALDPKVCSKFWLMYGGCKSEKAGSYRVTHVLDQDGDETTIAAAMDGFKIYNAFEEPIVIPDGKWHYYLPRILSTHPAGRDRDLVQMKTNLEWASEIRLNTAQERTIKHESINIGEAVGLAKELMPLIASWRSDGHDDWMQMGFCLYDIGDGSQEAFDLWVDFTKRTDRPNRDEARCMYEWNRMTRRECFTIGTLRHYASIDSPTEYEAWKRKRSGGRIKDVLDGGHAGLAQMLHDIYANVFVCADPEKGMWYAFRNHRWHRIKKATALRKKIKEDLVPRFIEEQKRIFKLLGEEEQEDDKMDKKLKAIRTIIKNLNSAPFKDCIVREMVDLFHDDAVDFIERLDSDINLIGFNNGVFDIRTMTFREGRPDDYISMTTGYDYVEFTEDDPRVLEVKDFFVKVFPDIQLRRFFLEYAAQLLKGGNFNKLFLNMVGGGDNAKSVTIELLEKTLGQYAVKFPTSLITGKRTQSAAASPEVIRSIGARFATIQEPDHKDIINVGILKEFTGNDSMFCRGLYSDGREFKPMFKLGLVTNKLINLSGNDVAIWNRILVLPFEACFPKDPTKVPKTWDEQYAAKIFHRDHNFSEKIPAMRQPLMWLLIQTLKEVFVRGPSDIPLKVAEATDRYKQNNDVFLQFITENVIHLDDEKGLTLTEAYSAFRQWHKDAFPAVAKNRPRTTSRKTSTTAGAHRTALCAGPGSRYAASATRSPTARCCS